MAIRNPLNQSIHDKVVRASVNTYSELVNQGHKVAINPGSEKNQWVSSDKLYPDLIVWKPDANDSTTGTAIIIEEIETEESVTEAEADQWDRYGKLQISNFRLIVPVSQAAQALEIVQRRKIRVTEIWHYSVQGDKIYFNKYFALP